MLTKKGEIPEEKREQLWLRASGASAMIHAFPGYYERLKERPIDYPNYYFHQINLDLIRTF